MALLFLKVCGAVASPTLRRSEQHCFPDRNLQCSNKSWQQKKTPPFLAHESQMLCRVGAFGCRLAFLYDAATQAELQKAAQHPRIDQIHFPILSILLPSEEGKFTKPTVKVQSVAREVLYLCVYRPFTAAWYARTSLNNLLPSICVHEKEHKAKYESNTQWHRVCGHV